MYGSQAWNVARVQYFACVVCSGRIALLFSVDVLAGSYNQNDCSVYCLVCKEKCGC